MPTPTPASPNGASSNTHTPQESRDLPPLLSSSYPITLKFIDVGYRLKIEDKQRKGGSIKRLFTANESSPSDQRSTVRVAQERTILKGVTGIAHPGEILAVLGPSGSGKSTLLNALAGRLHGQGLSGTILANSTKLTKPVLRRTGFVTQDDILYPHLTVRETLEFCAMLRLPRSLPRAAKVAAAESAMAELGLRKCEHTIIGNSFIRGVSGGERKRVSIAHEMLVDPSLLILDEPTSGLDSTAAHRLVVTLGSLAKKGKTVVTSVHQPSSRVYQMFEKVLVLSEGQCLYFGKGSDAMRYFHSVGFAPSFPMNPADFLLDLANGVSHVDGQSERDRPNIKQSLVHSYNTVLGPQVKAACMDTATVPTKNTHQPLRNSFPKECRHRDRVSLFDWFYQFSILLQRSLKERKHESFNTLRVFQVIAAALLAGLMWWHSDYRNIQDRLGLLFFISIFWGVFPSFNSVFAFPQERALFMKERASGMYTLSSYFMARIVGDLPMELILPTVFLVITYWMGGLKPDLWAFLWTLLVVLGYVLVSQGLGLALGAAIMDAKQASTVAAVTMLAFVLTGGYYVHKVPSCMAWIKYVSTTFYCYRLLTRIQYGDGKKISYLLGCYHDGGGDRASCKFIEEDVVGQIDTVGCIGVLFFMFVFYRLLAYLALRRVKS
ncbi:hypothetical protein RJT34_24784 [Clitoria ternatea]|uniref:ABC transporter domain-containing protein n=1 Tax=Clitoria ternatea TaxID=43366 RepID=A0AAN9IHV2_CLITE